MDSIMKILTNIYARMKGKSLEIILIGQLLAGIKRRHEKGVIASYFERLSRMKI